MSSLQERPPIPGLGPSMQRGLAWTGLAFAATLVFLLVLELSGALPEERFLPTDFQSARLLTNTLGRSAVALKRSGSAFSSVAMPWRLDKCSSWRKAASASRQAPAWMPCARQSSML